jgi:transcriptional regulator with XRE-family HTH domain
MIDDVNVERLGRLARMLRVRQRMTQAVLARRAGVSRQAVSLLETGRATALRLGVILSIIEALGGRFDGRVLWNGPELDRLVDARHAELTAWVKRRLERWGWTTRVEVSFNRYGERGRIDLLAYHPRLHLLVVIEVKTSMVDVQELLGTLDMKTRIAGSLGERFGWHIARIVPVIVFAEDPTTRRRLVRLAPLFDGFPLRGRAAISWLRHRTDPPPPGMLFLTAAPGTAVRQAGQQRVRPTRAA